MKRPSIFLNFPGNAYEAFSFYKSVFWWEFSFVETYFQEGNPMNVKPEEENLIMYIELNLFGIVLWWADLIPSYWQKFQRGNDFQITLNAESREEADEIFSKLSSWGNIEQSMSEEFFGYYWAFSDKFGVRWIIISE